MSAGLVSAGPHLFWITSRAAGTAALVTSSLSVTFGLMVGRRRTGDASLSDLRAVHEALSLATLSLIAAHGLSLLGDAFLHPGVAGIVIPFAGPYRPLWTGIGIVAGYGLAGLGLSYYARDSIGPKRWRSMHRFTALFWALGIAHTVGAGSDAFRVWFLLIAGLPLVPASVLLLGRIGQGLGSVLGLPRTESPVRPAP